jgi:pantothenate synthetase
MVVLNGTPVNIHPFLRPGLVTGTRLLPVMQTHEGHLLMATSKQTSSTMVVVQVFYKTKPTREESI